MSCLDLWVAAFDRLSEAIEAWDPCCDGVGAPPAGTEDVVTYDDTDIIDDNTDVEGETYPTDFPTLNDFREHQCGLAHKFAGSTDDLIDRIEGIATTAQNVIVFATLVVLAYANVIGMAVAAILAGGYAMVTASEIFGAASAFSELRDLLHRGDPFGADEAKTALSARYDDIVDAVYCANDATEAAAGLRTILDAELTGPLLVLSKLMWSTPMLRLAFEFQGTVPARTDCTCQETGDLEFLGYVGEANTTVTQIDPYTYRLQASGAVNTRITIWLQIEDCGAPTLAPGSLDWTAEIDGTVFGPAGANHRLVSAWSNPSLVCDFSPLTEVDINPFLDPISGTGDVPFVDSHNRVATISGNKHVGLSIECRTGGDATGTDIIARFKNLQRNVT